MKILIHLGVPTFASHVLRAVLVGNRTRFKNAGVLIPATGWVDEKDPFINGMRNGHVDLVAAINASAIGSRDNVYRHGLVTELLRSGTSGAVLSSDLFFHPNQGLDPRRTREVLGCLGDVHVAVCLRRQDYFVDEFYRAMLAWPNTRLGSGIESFVRTFLGNKWLNYRDRVSSWVDVFGADHVTVHSYDDVSTEIEMTMLLMSSLVSNDEIGELALPNQPGQVSVRPEIANVMRAVNRFENTPADLKRSIVCELNDEVSRLPNGVDDRLSLVDDDLWSELSEAYADQNLALASILMQGPSNEFCFPSRRPPTRLAAQLFTMPEARTIVATRWPELEDQSSRSDNQLGWATWRAVRVLNPAVPRVGITATIKAPLEQIRHWANFHLNSGYEHIALFVDGPPFYDELQGNPRISVINCDEEFWKNMYVVGPTVLDQKLRPARHLGHELLVAHGMDWTAGIDGDELLWGDVHAALATIADDVDVVRLRPSEAVQHPRMSIIAGFEPRVFKRLPFGSASSTRLAAEAYRHLGPFTKHGFFGHTEGKSIVRANVTADFWGSHTVANTSDPLTTVVVEDATVLHFESRPFNDWHATWANRIQQIDDRPYFSERQRNQYARIAEVFRENDESALRELYRTFYFVEDERIAALEDLGLATRLAIGDEMFSPNTEDPSYLR